MNYKSIICKQGYIINKSKFNESLINEIKSELTVEPFAAAQFFKKTTKFSIFLENKNKLCIPKYYGLDKLGKPEKFITSKFESINYKFNGKLRPKQQVVIDEVYDKLLKIKGGLLISQAGSGKTVMGLYLITLLKAKTLIIVHKSFLVNQWKDRIQQYLPSARIGIIQQNKIEIDDVDIAIGMLQSISMKEYESTTFDSFKFVIIDECHHISSEVFSRALPKISTKYMLGLSATPYREDKLEKVFNWYCGPILYQQAKENTHRVIVDLYKYNSKDPLFEPVYCKYSGRPMNSTMITNITQVKSRNKLIVNIIKDLKTYEPTRNILVLSARIDHLKELHEMLTDLKHKNIKQIGYYIGSTKQTELDRVAEECDVILATYMMCKEAFDLPKLDTLVMVTSVKEMEQTAGRILRLKMEDYTNNPKIIDINDNITGFRNQCLTRLKLYKSRKYIVNTFTTKEDKITKTNLYNSEEQCDQEEEPLQLLSDSD